KQHDVGKRKESEVECQISIDHSDQCVTWMFLFPPFINSFYPVPLFPQFLHSHSQLSSKFTLFYFNMKNNTLTDHEHYHHSTRFLHNPSFSSTLLDQIYRSIDQSEQHNYTNTPNHMNTFFTQTTSRTEKNKKQETSTRSTSLQTSTHSSLSSSKSCLSKTLTSEREKLRNGAKRTVRFYPVSVIVGEEGINNKVATKTWKNSTNVEKSKVVKEAAREFLEEYHKNKNKNNLVSEALMDLHKNNNSKINNANEDDEHDNDDDDDVASCASSDLFELDHLAELPVYETTHVSTN
ncbi:hypothetical protein HN51_042146, partial [Arachis hypogaea]